MAQNSLGSVCPVPLTVRGNPDAIEVVTYGQTSTANSKPYIETTTQGNTPTQVELFDGFVSAVKDGDSIKLTTEAGNDVTVGPFSGRGGGASSTTNHPTSALTSNSGFSGTPPATITLTGNWGTSGYNLTRTSHTTGARRLLESTIETDPSRGAELVRRR